MNTILSKPLVQDLKKITADAVARLADRHLAVHMAVIQVGGNPDSLRYIGYKAKAAKETGIIFSEYLMEDNVTKARVEETIRFLNDDPEVQGIFIQLPLPDGFSSADERELLASIDPYKDADGLTEKWKSLSYTDIRMTSLLAPRPYALPPMVLAVASLLDYYQLDVKDKKVVIVGDGRLTGAPLYDFFAKLKVDVELVTEETENALKKTQRADILVTDIGQKDMITYQWVKEGVVVIDCAEDVHTDSVSQVASALAPSKGGVGPLTVQWLLYNVVQSTLNMEGGV
ncbi:bifunctional 5,10-methylenetetrahydrofolate dehydrogenase/5,10-methenyltetrahydrofolate cyclohydrolase [Patescibacteria group bacterium]|nr:bifunctional 5,10-methylenetetrahydrofolate dehydrogenase/5,10-methenyltetrahydrofolate cyclohydrolase [Patescibacteria group bacterium]